MYLKLQISRIIFKSQNLQMKLNPVLFILTCLLGICACITPKEARQLKKNTPDWRKSPVVLEAYADSPFAGIFLIFRENKKFEHTSSGMLQTFEAGSWTINQDTIHMYYVDYKEQIKETKKVYIDRTTATLIFESDTLAIPTRLRILLNEL